MGKADDHARLRAVAHRYGVQAVDDVPFGAQPLERHGVDEESAERLANLGWEQPLEAWRPIATDGTPVQPPRRFVDGSVNGRTAATLTVSGRLRPAQLAVVGAMALDLDGRELRRTPGSLHTESMLCVFSNQVPSADLDELQGGLAGMG